MRIRTYALLTLGLIATGIVLITPAPKAEATAPAMAMRWVQTGNLLGCDPQSQASECAEWQTVDGNTSLLICCVPPDALNSSDFSACADGGRSRGRTEL